MTIAASNYSAADEMWKYISAFRAYGGAMGKTGQFKFEINKEGKGYLFSGMNRMPLPTESKIRIASKISAMLEEEEALLLEKFRQLILPPATTPAPTDGSGATTT